MKNVDVQNIITQYPGAAEVVIGADGAIKVDGEVAGHIEVEKAEETKAEG